MRRTWPKFQWFKMHLNYSLSTINQLQNMLHNKVFFYITAVQKQLALWVATMQINARSSSVTTRFKLSQFDIYFLFYAKN